jgi:hypothetical protein
VGVAIFAAVAAGATTIATGDQAAFTVAAAIAAALVGIAATLIPSVKPTAGQARPTRADSGDEARRAATGLRGPER